MLRITANASMALILAAWLSACQTSSPSRPRTVAGPVAEAVPTEAITLIGQAEQAASSEQATSSHELLVQAIKILSRENQLTDAQATQTFDRIVSVMRTISPAYDTAYPDIQVPEELDRLYGRLNRAARVGTQVNRIYLLLKLGCCYDAQGDFFTTLESHRQAYVMASESTDQGIELETYRATSALLVGKAYLRMQEFFKARRHTLIAIELYRKLGLRPERSWATAQLAKVLSSAGSHETALEQILLAQRQYQSLLDEDRDRYYLGYGRILQELGGVYRRMEAYNKAIPALEQALTIHKVAAEHPRALEERIALLAGLGMCYEGVNNPESADWSYGLLQDEVRKLPEPYPLFWSFNLGEIMARVARRDSHKGHFTKAAEAYHMAVKAYYSIPAVVLPKKSARIASAQYGRGVALHHSGKNAQAEEALIDSVKRLHKINRELPPEQDPTLPLLSLGVALAELGQTLTALDRFREAEAVLMQSVKLLGELHDREPSIVREYLYAVSVRAKMYEATERYRLASDDVENCVEVYASLPGHLADRAEALVGMIYLQSALLARNLTGRTASNSQVVRKRIKLGMEIAANYPHAPYINDYIDKLGLTRPEPSPAASATSSTPVDLPVSKNTTMDLVPPKQK